MSRLIDGLNKRNYSWDGNFDTTHDYDYTPPQDDGGDDGSSDGGDGGGNSVLDQVLAGDVNGLVNDVVDTLQSAGRALVNHYNVSNVQDIQNSISDDDGNITPESIQQYEAPLDYDYSQGYTGDYEQADSSNPMMQALDDPSYNAAATTRSGFFGNLGNDFQDWTKTVDADASAIPGAYYDMRTEDSDESKQAFKDAAWKLYEDGIANPAMKVAATPFIPAPARIVAGALATPDLISSTVNAFEQGYDGSDGSGNGGVLGGGANVLSSLIAQPLEELGQAVTHPMDTLDDIYEHPSDLYNKVLEPAMAIELPYKGAKKINDVAYNHSEHVRDFEDPIKDKVDEYKDKANEVLDKYVPTYEDYRNAPDDVDAGLEEDITPDTGADGQQAPQSSGFTGPGSEYDGEINQACAEYGVDPALAHAVAQIESQHGEATSNVFGVNGVSDPHESVRVGVKSLKGCLDDNGGDVVSALREYNGNAVADYPDRVLGIANNEYGGMGKGGAGSMSGLDSAEHALLGTTMDNHGNGCAEAACKLGSWYDPFLKEEADKGQASVPNLISDARAAGRYIDFDESKLEKGDIIVYDGDEHVTVYDGKGGYVGNSTSADQIVHSHDYTDCGTPTGIIKSPDTMGGGRGPISMDDTETDFSDLDSSAESEDRAEAESNAHAFDDANKEQDDALGNLFEDEPNEDYDAPDKEGKQAPQHPDEASSVLGDDEQAKASEIHNPDDAQSVLDDDNTADLSGLSDHTVAGAGNQLLQTKAESIPLEVFPKSEQEILKPVSVMDEDGRAVVPAKAILDEAYKRQQVYDGGEQHQTAPKQEPAKTHEPDSLDESIGGDMGYDDLDYEDFGDEEPEHLKPAEVKTEDSMKQDVDDAVKQVMDEGDDEPAPKSETATMAEDDMAYSKGKSFKDRMKQDIDDAVKQVADEGDDQPAPKSSGAREAAGEFDYGQEAPKEQPKEQPKKPVSEDSVKKEDTPDLPKYTKGKSFGKRDTIKPEHIADRIEQLFGVTVHTGERMFGGISGIYKRKIGSIRTANWGDIDNLAHELGHKLASHIRVPNMGRYFDEFKTQVEKNHGESAYRPEQYYHEGQADFMADYLMRGKEVAARHFPQYYKAFTDMLGRNDDMKKRVDDVYDLYQRYRRQTPEQRAMGGVHTGKDDKPSLLDRLRNLRDNFVSQVFDDKAPMKDIDEMRKELTHKKDIDESDSVYATARLAQGSAAERADMLVSGKHPEMVQAALNKVYGDGTIAHAVTLKNTLKALGKAMHTKEGRAYLKKAGYRDGVEALDILLSAQRFRELQENELDFMADLGKNITDAGKAAEEDKMKWAIENGQSFPEVHTHEVFDRMLDRYAQKNAGAAQAMKEALRSIGYKDAEERARMDDEIAKAHEKGDTETEEKLLAQQFAFPDGTTGDQIIHVMHEAAKQYFEDVRDHYPASMSMEDAQAVIDRAPAALKKAADDVHKMTDNVLRILNKSGMISDSAYKAMKEKYKNYIPLVTERENDSGVAAAFGVKGFSNMGDAIKDSNAKPREEKTMRIKSPLEQVLHNTYSLLDMVERNKVAQKFVKGVNEIPGSARLAEETKAPADPHTSTFSVWIDGEKHNFQTTPEFYQALQVATPKQRNAVWNAARAIASLVRSSAVIMPDFALKNFIRDTASAGVFGGFMTLAHFPEAMFHVMRNIFGSNQLMHDYRASGVLTSTLVGLDRNSLQGHIGELYGRGKWGTVKHLADIPINVLQQFSKAVETIPRLAEYQRQIKNGASREKAALAARDITLDFSKAGKAGRELNEITAFANATLQESARIVQGIREHPAHMLAYCGLFMASSIAFYLKFNYGQQWYDDRPEWEKNTYWMWRTGDGVIHRAAKPFGLGMICCSLPERLIEHYKGGKPFKQNVPGWFSALKDAFVPDMIPNIVLPFFEYKSNYSLFKDAPINSQYYKGQQKQDKNATYLGHVIADKMQGPVNALNSLFGGHSKFTPTDADYFGGQLGGGIYKWVSNASSGKGPGEMMAKTFTGVKSTQSQSDFMDAKQELSEKYQATSKGTFRGKHAQEYNKQHRLSQMSDKDRYNYQLLEAAQKKLDIVNKQEGKISDDELRAQRQKIMHDAMKMYRY